MPVELMRISATVTVLLLLFMLSRAESGAKTQNSPQRKLSQKEGGEPRLRNTKLLNISTGNPQYHGHPQLDILSNIIELQELSLENPHSSNNWVIDNQNRHLQPQTSFVSYHPVRLPENSSIGFSKEKKGDPSQADHKQKNINRRSSRSTEHNHIKEDYPSDVPGRGHNLLNDEVSPTADNDILPWQEESPSGTDTKLAMPHKTLRSSDNQPWSHGDYHSVSDNLLGSYDSPDHNDNPNYPHGDLSNIGNQSIPLSNPSKTNDAPTVTRTKRSYSINGNITLANNSSGANGNASLDEGLASSGNASLDEGLASSGNSARPSWEAALDLAATIIMTCNTINLMLGMGAATYWKDVLHHAWPPAGTAIGMTCQFLLLPAVGTGLSVAFGLTTYEAVGVLMISCSPGGSFSNFFTFWCNGDLALSIVMTTFSSVLAFVGMPLNLWLYSRLWLADDDDTAFAVPYVSIMTALVFITVPAAVGMVIRHFKSSVAATVTKVASVLGFLGCAAVMVIWPVLYWEVFVRATPLLYLAAFLLPLLGFGMAYTLALIMCRSHKVCRTIGIETGSQNMAVAFSIIVLTFHDHEVKANIMLFPTLYALTLLLEMFFGILAFRLWVAYKARSKDVQTHPEEDGNLEEKGALDPTATHPNADSTYPISQKTPTEITTPSL